MAAGSNWKRPWEDDERTQHYNRRRADSDSAKLQAGLQPPKPPFSWQAPKMDERKLAPIPNLFRHPPSSSPGQQQPLYIAVGKETEKGPSAVEMKFPGSPKRQRLQVHTGPGLPSSRRLSESALKRHTPGIPDFHAPSVAPIYTPFVNEDQQHPRPKSDSPRGFHDCLSKAESWPGVSTNCSNCRGLHGIVQEILSNLLLLTMELHAGRTADMTGLPLNQAPDASSVGLKEAMEWALQVLVTALRLVQRQAAPLTVDPGRISAISGLSSFGPTAPETSQRQGERAEFENGSLWKVVHPVGPSDDALRHQEAHMMDESRRNSCAGDPLSLPTHSPPRTLSSSGSIYMNSHSPVQSALLTRLLPSPSSLNLSSSQPGTVGSPSTTRSDAVQAAHLGDLQHQVSTKTLALQTLQQEHDNLLAAFSRSRTRCASLEKKCQISESEVNSLDEERLKLQGQIENLESQIEDLMKSRDEARKQSVANGGQYMKIMSMAGKLEAQGAADRQKWKMKEEDWEREKVEMKATNAKLQDEITQLSSQLHIQDREVAARGDASFELVSSLGKDVAFPTAFVESNTKYSVAKRHSTPLNSATETAALDISTVFSPEKLREEICRLRSKCRGMEAALRGIQAETHRMESASETFRSLSETIIQRAEGAINA